MPLDVASLESLQTTAVTASLYFRHVFLPFAGDPDPLHVHVDEGRWSTGSTLYTANSVPVVWAEYCRWAPVEIAAADPTGGIGITRENLEALAPIELGDPVPRRALFALRISFTRLADLTTPDSHNALALAGFDLGNFYSDDLAGCTALAAAGETLGWEGVLAPSAAWRFGDGYTIAVFSDGRKRVDRLNKLVGAARPTVGVAYATTYRERTRPSWLGPAPVI